MHTVIVEGWNYEGAHFRGIDSDTDELSVRLTITGEDEKQIANFITEQFSYGNEVESMSEVAAGYNCQDIPNGDGCGGVVKIIHNGKEVFKDEYYDTEFGDDEVIPLSITLQPGIEYNHNVLNKMVADYVEQISE